MFTAADSATTIPPCPLFFTKIVRLLSGNSCMSYLSIAMRVPTMVGVTRPVRSSANISWFPKELTAQFVKACPTCTLKRSGNPDLMAMVHDKGRLSTTQPPLPMRKPVALLLARMNPSTEAGRAVTTVTALDKVYQDQSPFR